MATKTIYTKLGEKTLDDTKLREFLQKIIQFELGIPGWYEKEYSRILDEACDEEGKNNEV
ncbi:MAG: hypothetical protein WC383_13055 [Gammaproteobacteria bacterium]